MGVLEEEALGWRSVRREWAAARRACWVELMELLRKKIEELAALYAAWAEANRPTPDYFTLLALLGGTGLTYLNLTGVGALFEPGEFEGEESF